MKKQILFLAMLLLNLSVSFASTVFYSDYPSIPDFKSVSNTNSRQCSVNDYGLCYDYDNKKYTGSDLLIKYAKILENAGFKADKSQWKIITGVFNGKEIEQPEKIVYYDDKNNLRVIAEIKYNSATFTDYRSKTKTTFYNSHIAVYKGINSKPVTPYRDENGRMTCGNGYRYIHTMVGDDICIPL